MRHYIYVANRGASFHGLSLPVGACYGKFNGMEWVLINRNRQGYNSINLRGETPFIFYIRDDIDFYNRVEKKLPINDPLVKLVLKNMGAVSKDRLHFKRSDYVPTEILMKPAAPRKHKGTALKEASKIRARRKDMVLTIPKAQQRRDTGVNRVTDYSCGKDRYSYHPGYGLEPVKQYPPALK